MGRGNHHHHNGRMVCEMYDNDCGYHYGIGGNDCGYHYGNCDRGFRGNDCFRNDYDDYCGMSGGCNRVTNALEHNIQTLAKAIGDLEIHFGNNAPSLGTLTPLTTL